MPFLGKYLPDSIQFRFFLLIIWVFAYNLEFFEKKKTVDGKEGCDCRGFWIV